MQIIKSVSLDRLSKVIADGSYQLCDALNVIVLGTDETQGALPWVLSKATHSLQWLGDRGKVFWVLFTPDAVHVGDIDGCVEVLVYKASLELDKICRIWLYCDFNFLYTQPF